MLCAITLTSKLGMHSLPLVLMLLLSQSSMARAGTRVEAKLQSTVDTRTSKVGDEVAAVLVKPILAENATLVPRGSRLHGRIETITAATQSDEGRFRIVFREIEFADGRRTATWITDSFAASPPNRTLRYFLFPGIGGAIGALAGGSRLRATAGIGGALIGFIIAMDTGNGTRPDVTLPAGRILHLQLGEDLVLR